MRLPTFVLLLVASCGSATGHAQQPPTDTIFQSWLDTATITALRQTTQLAASPISATVIQTAGMMNVGQGLSLDELLVSVPGMLAFNGGNFTQDLRLSIRGFGARAAFGIRGLKLLLDGFPETTPDGQGQVDNIEPSLLQSVEVARGPLATLHGNASGGYIHFKTFAERADSNNTSFKMNAGAFGFRKAAFHHSQPINDHGHHFHFGGAFTQYRGFREHAGMKQVNLNGGLTWRNNNNSEVGLRINYLDSPWAEDPGAITHEQASSNPSRAWSGNVIFDAGEQVRQIRSGIYWKTKVLLSSELEVRAWYTHRLFDNRLPFRNGGIVSLERHFYGANTQFSHSGSFLKTPYEILVGFDLDIQHDLRQRFDNLEGQRGKLVFGQTERFTNTGLFISHKWQFCAGKTLHLGARISSLEARAGDQYFPDGDQSGARQWLQPDFFGGLSWSISPTLLAFGNVATTFETPTLQELSNNPEGTGGFNPHLSPQRAWSAETGLRKHWLQERLLTSLSTYYIRIGNEILPYELPQFPGRTFYRNNGTSRRLGLELAVEVSIVTTWKLWLAYTFSQFNYLTYDVGGERFTGHFQPGIPRHAIGAVLVWNAPRGFQFQLLSKSTSKVYLDDANTDLAPSVMLLHLRLGWQWSSEVSRFQVYTGVNNLTNTIWFDNLRVNAFGGRYFEPGAPRHIFGGISARF